MYITKAIDPNVVACALRSVVRQAGLGASQEVLEAVGQLSQQLMMGYPLDALEGTVAAEYIGMMITCNDHFTRLLEIGA